MKIGFDSEKDRRNIAKHGVSLALAADLEWDQMVCREDHREDYGELRLQCFAPIADRLYCLICTENDDNYRAISLREATPQEVKYYVRYRQHR
ncbi:BrnT family toxin [Thiospirillum jenense]|uniref:BrnT family toxin n=1 Tax=Thiospirillum jenense TaxID=1653858 RepID=A0A839HGK6_9GAMM|nr:BrnT family toxin [Thiospirillum jenense]MBB1125432.1 BrnT family toxin [Thiospirillum jenense]